ncbi:MAG: hypothetical protein ACI80V_002073 [Rhodothermales bacterium]
MTRHHLHLSRIVCLFAVGCGGGDYPFPEDGWHTFAGLDIRTALGSESATMAADGRSMVPVRVGEIELSYQYSLGRRSLVEMLTKETEMSGASATVRRRTICGHEGATTTAVHLLGTGARSILVAGPLSQLRIYMYNAEGGSVSPSFVNAVLDRLECI